MWDNRVTEDVEIGFLPPWRQTLTQHSMFTTVEASTEERAATTADPERQTPGQFCQVSFTVLNYCVINNSCLPQSESPCTAVLPLEFYAAFLNSGVLVRQRTIPTERPPLVGEVSDKFSGQRVSRGQHYKSPRPLI
jgi:hypothetical protein